MRGDGKSASSEKAELLSGEIIQYSTGITNIIARLRLTNSCDDTEISFQRDWNNDGVVSDNATDLHNPYAPSDKSCHVFDPAGGGIDYRTPHLGALDSSKSSIIYFGRYETMGQAQINNIATTCADASCADLLWLLRNITDEVCASINNKSGINGNIDEAITNLGGGSKSFIGVYGYVNVGSITDNANFDGKSFGCMYHPGSDENRFYMILIER